MANNLEILKLKIAELLNKMGIAADVYERVEEGQTVFNIKTSDAQILIGKQGANLEALQYIVRLLVRKDLTDERFPFALDVDDYKDKRVIYLKELARKAAHQARQSQRSVALAPMPAYERRVIHNYLSLYNDLSSESMGDEPNRRIVIRNKTRSEQGPKDAFDFLENA